jgi:hypothetical protein
MRRENILIIVLSLSALFFGFRLLDKPAQTVEVNNQQSWLDTKDRKFPEDFTEEEKLALVPQTDDIPKDIHRRWDETIRVIAESTETLTLEKFGDDCFGRPTVVKTGIGRKIKVVNPQNSEITLGMGERAWTIPANSSLEISPEFKILPDFKDVFSYGYGCGAAAAPSGLFFVDEFTQ